MLAGGNLSSLLIIQDLQNERHNQNYIVDKLPDWDCYIFNSLSSSEPHIKRQIREKEIHFFIYESFLDHEAAMLLAHLQHQFPLLSVIYYNALLKDGEFSELHHAGISHCIVGESRQINLIDTLNKLWSLHWKRVPDHILEAPTSQLSPRAGMIIRMIEHNPIRECNTFHLAKELSISESHFRKEFKRHFQMNFREFKNRLFTHYETVLLLERKLRPGHIFEILDYKNISAFSRSFKMRHGNSWQHLVRNKN
jgi:AraC-like DNA-binding protein